MTTLFLSDAEVDALCDGLTQDAAKVRFLRRLGLKVDRKPNGRPLAWRPTETVPEAAQNPQTGPNVVGLDQWSRSRRHGPQTQRR